jgi:aspartate-semialdehyde dehydrogenase
MSGAGLRVAVLGATGSVGTELLRVLEERAFPVSELRAVASPESAGAELEFHGLPLRVEALRLERLLDLDLVFCAAPGVLTELLEPLRRAGVRGIDLTGALELDPTLPLHRPGEPAGAAEGVPWVAVPRGIVGGLALVLAALEGEVEILRVTVLALEPASGVGRRGVDELSDQTVHLLRAMTGEAGDARVFPRPLAFDCVPLVGEPLPSGETSEERRLAHVLRRLLRRPALAVETTRIRVPVFSGSLAAVHIATEKPLALERARALWAQWPQLRVVDAEELPTPRASVGEDAVLIGRLRPAPGAEPGIGFVLALDDLRRGAALGAVEAAEALCGGG